MELLNKLLNLELLELLELLAVGAVGGQIRLPIALSFRAIGFGHPIGIFIHKDRQNQWHIFVVENDLILNKATFGHTA